VVRSAAVAHQQLIFGNILINPSAYKVLVDGLQVELTFCEFELLHRFCQEPDRIIDYDSLCQTLWDSHGPKERRRLSVTVCRLRAKLTSSEPYRLETVRGRGYGLIESLPFPQRIDAPA
jgi:DNA-binding response OmpR family regulator